MENLYCHIKASLRHEKCLSKRISPKWDFHSNFTEGVHTASHKSRLTEATWNVNEPARALLEPVTLLRDLGPVTYALCCPR